MSSIARRDYQGVVFTRLAQNPKVDVTPQKPGGSGRQSQDFSKLPGFDPDITTVKKMPDGKLICKHFNIQKGCSFGSSCKFVHVCDVSVNGTACGSRSHNRLGHKAAVGAAAAAGSSAEEAA